MTGRTLLKCIQLIDYFRIKGMSKLTKDDLHLAIEMFAGSSHRCLRHYEESMLKHKFLRKEGEYFIIDFGVADEIAALTS